MKTDTVDLPKPDTHCHDEDTGKDVWSHSPEQVREYAAQVAAVENYGLLSLLFDIRKASGDPLGKLMQDELVAHIAALRVDAERYRWLREQHWSSAPFAVVVNPKDSVKLGHVCPSLDLLDEAIDAARAAK